MHNLSPGSMIRLLEVTEYLGFMFQQNKIILIFNSFVLNLMAIQ